jgi:hypothetical protein
MKKPSEVSSMTQEEQQAALSHYETVDPSRNGGHSHAGVSAPDESQTAEEWDESDEERRPEPLVDEALHGLAGDIVNTIAPHTESDPAALLFQFLCSFGNAAGRHAYYQVEADRHYTNLYAVLVGVSAKGRKGTSKGHIKRLFRDTDESWTTNCNRSGLSSGEGLIWAVRDPVEAIDLKADEGGTKIVDPGVEGKRLLVTEGEFASTLRVMGRDGSTLSPVIRNGWDDGTLQILTKNLTARATDAHISIIGHITAEELRRYLDSTEAANGFANRFLWVCVRRSKFLPEGGNIQNENFQPILERLGKALDFARQERRVRFDDEAREIWYGIYRELSEGQPGMFGAVTALAEAQSVRLALIYALLDSSEIIRKLHLLAALAVWDYCRESAGCIFGDTLGDPIRWLMKFSPT